MECLEMDASLPRPGPPAGAGAPLLERPLRANPAFELVLFDRLSEGERRLLAGLARDPDHYGVLRPRHGSGLGIKAVDRETALLVLTLARPGPLPAYVRARLGDQEAQRALVRLVADGVLEIEQEEGRFVSGPAAIGLAAVPGEPGGRLAELSRAALLYGQRLAETLPAAFSSPLRLSPRLYGFNRRPLGPRWRRALPSAGAVRGFLGIAPGGAWRGLLDRHWREDEAAAGEVWLHWRPSPRRRAAGTARGAGGRSGAATYKLYVSPSAEALPEGFGRVLDGLAAAGAPGFKVGGGAGGLLRPDKIVAYFATFERLAEAAAALGERLAGTAAHGVPFTAEIAGDGLLSWGVDPPAASGLALPWSGGRQSWRLWLTDRLARALIAGVATAAAAAGVGPAGDAAAAEPGAGPAPQIVEPWRFAIERLRLEGIDTDTWTPGGRLRRRQGEWA
jgi:hypothetical protein